MPRALITIVFATSLSALTIAAAVGPAIGRPIERSALLVEIATPIAPTLAMTIL
jgi:hypothetical protein